MTIERSTRAEGVTAEKILVAAAVVFRDNPAASMEAVAAEAGLSRATVHRHFPARADMVRSLQQQAVETVADTFVEASVGEEPPVVRLYSVTRRLLEAKIDWSWVLRDLEFGVEAEHNSVLAHAINWMGYLREHRYLSATADPAWAATVYLTLVKAATAPLTENESMATRSARAVDAFLHGVGDTNVRYL